MSFQSRAHTLILKQSSGEEGLRGIVTELLAVLEAGFSVPVVFLSIVGDGGLEIVSSDNPVLFETVRLLMMLEQPVYGVALGRMGQASISILQACDRVFAQSAQTGLLCRVLRLAEIGVVMGILTAEVECMDLKDIMAAKARLVEAKLAKLAKLAKCRLPELIPTHAEVKYVFDM
mmetsp:Transcript_14582/g.27336  ORF Transcript_14582/g.27336 Transcript_14582/m.27336 type:complete len:175 (+) Transcript_14582:40-564(+)